MKIRSIITAITLLSVLAFPHQVFAFSDVVEGNRHFVAIKFLEEQGMIEGYSDGTFKSNQQINRAEALTMLEKAIKKPTINSNDETPPPFADVTSKDWFYNVVKKAHNDGIISGYPDKLFHPERTIKKVEALKIVILKEKIDLPVIIENPPYSDTPTDSWFAPYAFISRQTGLVLPSRENGGELLGEEIVNRGQFAELIYHTIQSLQGSIFGRATYYADSLAGRSTSGGELYQPKVFTSAHKTLPMGTKLLVKNLANGKTVAVKVNDRGPYATGVELDLSRSAFEAIASASTGIINIEYQIEK